METGFSPNYVRNELAEFYIDIGRLDDADRLLRFEATTSEQSGAHEDLGEMLVLQAMLARDRGQLDQAQQLAEHGVAELRLTGDPSVLSEGLSELSSIHTALGNLGQAEKDLAEVHAGESPESQGEEAIARAELGIAKGQFQNGAREAEKAAAAFDKAHLDDQSAQAFITAADALEMSGRTADAVGACREAEKRASLTPNEESVALAQVCTWRAGAAKGDAVPANLKAMIGKLRNPELKLDLDYARAVRAKRAGASNYRALCGEMADAAGRLGYITLARRAASLRE